MGQHMAATFLQPKERVELTKIIADLYEFKAGGARDRYVLIEQANLQRFAPGINLVGPPRTVAGELISRLERYGFLQEMLGYHALGALLVYVHDRNETPADDTRFLAGLIVRYSLVQDAGYIKALRI